MQISEIFLRFNTRTTDGIPLKVPKLNVKKSTKLIISLFPFSESYYDIICIVRIIFIIFMYLLYCISSISNTKKKKIETIGGGKMTPFITTIILMLSYVSIKRTF